MHYGSFPAFAGGGGISLFARTSGGSHKHSVRVFAILAVAIMLLSCITVLYSADPTDEDFTDDDYYVVYEPGTVDNLPKDNNKLPGSTGYQKVKVKYDGYAVAEYNPQFWSTGSSGYSNSIDEHATVVIESGYANAVKDWYGIEDYVKKQTIVFVGWKVSGTDYVVDPGTDLLSSDYAELWSKKTLTLIAQWDTLYDVFYVDGNGRDDSRWGWIGVEDDGSKSQPTSMEKALSNISVEGNRAKYRSIILLYFNDNENRNIAVSTINKTVTIRSYVSSNDENNGSLKTLNFDTTWDILADCIIDNVRIDGKEASADAHGVQDEGIRGNSKSVILGTGISDSSKGVQVSGLSSSGTLSDIVVFSGNYQTIMGGSPGSSSALATTSVKILGGTVTDSVYGGHGVQSNKSKLSETNVLIAGGSVWDGSTYSITNSAYQTVVGGSRLGEVDTSNVDIVGKAKVFAVQGGGRSGGSSHVDTANVTVAGDSYVVYMVCGAVTDGNPVEGKFPVVTANVVIGGSAKVGTSEHPGDVLGGGWDTFARTEGPGVRYTDVTIKESAVVNGSVYGGGFRGTVGTDDPDKQGSTTVNILGGKITGSVFGGGSGGADPLSEAEYAETKNDPTGIAYVYGTTNITMQDGTVGSIYGGGEGVLFKGEGTKDVASVFGSTSVTISGGTVEHSVYGGGMGVDEGTSMEVAMVTGGTSVTISGGTVKESVYGGGALGLVSGPSISVIVTGSTANPAKVLGAIFGGGKGVTGQPDIAKVDVNSISVSVFASNVGETSTQYAVFGGGAAAYSEADSVCISIGGGSTVNGDVYGGGYGVVPGDDEPEASNAEPIMLNGERTLVINGATINGSVYGGSRLGHDAPQDYDGNQSKNAVGSVSIRLLAGVVMQGVYGGGFMGHSLMDATILVGSCAVEAEGAVPYLTVYNGVSGYDLRINSIYGGGNLNSPGEAAFQKGSELLMGDATIEISGGPVPSVDFAGYVMPGPSDVSDVPKISIYGDIFGQGNYSAIGGTSTISIHDYDQDCEYFIQSIQRANELLIEDASIVVEGSADGTSTGLSISVSINSITKKLVLGGGTVLDLRAQTSGIQSYESYIDGNLAQSGDYTTGYEEGTGNEIVLRDGRMLYILGPDDIGPNNKDDGTGLIKGYTIISRAAGDTYYGAFAVGSMYTDEESGFVIRDDSGRLSPASYIYGTGDSQTKAWYISGHVSVGMVLNFGTTSDDGSQNWSAFGTAILPHMSNGSMLAYAAAYANPTVQNGFYILTEDDYNSYVEADGFVPVDDIGVSDFFSMTISGSDAGANTKRVAVKTHEYVSGSGRDSLQRYYFSGDSAYEEVGNANDFAIRVDASLISNSYLGMIQKTVFGTTGNVGVITLHLAEVIPYTLNGSVSYLPVNFVDVEVTLNVLPRSGLEPIDLSVTIMTTVSGGRCTGTGYVLFPSLGNRHSYTITSDVDGDLTLFADTTYLSSKGWVASQYMSDGLNGSDAKDKEFGEGGVKDSVMRIFYSGDGEKQSTVFTVVATAGNETVNYRVTVHFQEAKPVDLALQYRDIDGDVHGLEVTMDQSTGIYTFVWSDSPSESIKIPFGGILESETITYMRDGQQVTGTIGEMMGWLLTLIPDETLEDRSIFTYSKSLDGWYVSETLKYNMTSELKESLTLTAKFGIKVSFVGQYVHLETTSVYIRPGTTLKANGIGEPGDEGEGLVIPWDGTAATAYPGYHLAGEYWTLSSSAPVGGFTDAYEFSFDDTVLYTDTTLYVPWEPNKYTMKVTVEGGDPSSVLSFEGLWSTEEISWTQNSGSWNATLSVAFGLRVVVTADDGYRISSAVCSYGDNSVAISGVPGMEMAFVVPNAGDDGKGTLELEIHLRTGVTVTVGYTGDGDLSSGLGDGSATISFGSFGSVSFTGNNPDSKGAVVDSGSITISVSLPTGYRYAMWMGETMLTDSDKGSIGGRVTESVTLTLDVQEDVELTFSVYRQVELKDIGEGISSVAVAFVDVSGNESEAVEAREGDVLFEGYILTVVTDDAYTMSTSQVGTDAGTMTGSSMVYLVLGTVDVELTATLQSTEVSIIVVFRDENEIELDAGMTTKLTGMSIRFDFSLGSSSTVTIVDGTISDARMTFTAQVPTDAYNSTQLTVGLEGFETGTISIPLTSDRFEGTVHLDLIAYTIEYRSLNGSLFDSEIWTVISEKKAPHCDKANVLVVGGSQVWMEMSDGAYAVVDSIEAGDSQTITYYAMPRLTGEAGVPKVISVTATQSQFAQGVVVDLGVPGFQVHVFTWSNTHLVSYDADTKTLKVEGAGTGQFTVFHDGTGLSITILPDLEGGSEAVGSGR